MRNFRAVSALCIGMAALSVCTTVGFAPVGAVTVATSAGAVSAKSAASAARPAKRGVKAAASLQWRECPERRGAQCASLIVAVDNAQPGSPLVGPTISIEILRVPARNQSKRIGSLVVNPGGPGASARTFARQFAAIASKELRDRFDIVGFDPRGVGASAPIRCVDGPTQDRLLHEDPSPDNPAERQDLLDAAVLFANGCKTRNGALLGRVSTQDAILDMESLRIALGEEKLTYMGFSYGTFLGAAYADKYPTRVRAFVLDGALDPAATADERARLQANGFERALDQFLKDCDTKKKCPFNGPDGSRVRFEKLSARVEANDIPGKGKRKVGPGELTTAVLAALYSREFGWPRLTRALALADKGDGSGILEMFDGYVDRNENGTYLNTNDANVAINCLDSPADRDAEHYDALAKELAVVSPHFGSAIAYYGLQCAAWLLPIRTSPVPRAVGSAPILVVGTTGDPATPYIWAKKMATDLENAVLLTLDGEGHTAYIGGPDCIVNAVDRYVLTLDVPRAGTRCSARG
jgi:pimeloyl-ACP methyl ester carboxylesterase